MGTLPEIQVVIFYCHLPLVAWNCPVLWIAEESLSFSQAGLIAPNVKKLKTRDPLILVLVPFMSIQMNTRPKSFDTHNPILEASSMFFGWEAGFLAGQHQASFLEGRR